MLPRLPVSTCSQFRALLLFVLMCGAQSVLAQQAPVAAPTTPPEPSAGSAPPTAQSNTPASTVSSYKADSEKLQANVNAAVRALRDVPRLKNASPKYLQAVTEFVTGNMLFVLLHELGHASITQMGVSVLGRMEDAADSFAAQKLIRVGSEFSEHVLADAAMGWFLADRRDRKTGDTVAYYDEHGLNQQRAYQIVCLMVGSDEDKFKNLATQTKLPEARQETCAGDYSNAIFSWAQALKDHRRTADQPKVKIDVVYGPATGRLEVIAQAARSIQLLETVADHAADELAWPTPFTLEMQSCGFPNARWDLSTKKLTLCYELGADFADLYRAYGEVRPDGSRLADNTKPKSAALVSVYKPGRSGYRKHK